MSSSFAFLMAAADLRRPRDARSRPFRWHLIIALGLLLGALAWLVATTPFDRALRAVEYDGLTIVSADGQPIARRGRIVDDPVAVAALPTHVSHAFIAIEDRRFLQHRGIDPGGLVRAAVRNLLSGGISQGGSTITQQLAKVSVLSADRSVTRKAREMLLALWMDARLSKEEILSRYLSTVYFGDGVYGLRAASLHYFDRPPEALGIEQAAMLAGLVNAPSRLAPTRNLEGAQSRSELVLDAMVGQGFLSAEDRASMAPADVQPGSIKNVPAGTYFADWVRARAGAVPSGRAVIRTTLDSRMQALAEQAVAGARIGGAQAALVAMRPDGRILAMVGGRDYSESPFNRATQARRQPGSTFKLFVWLAAVRAGLRPDTLIDDLPITVGTWQPRNHGDEYRGRITLLHAFARSSNSAAVQLSEWVGRDRVIMAARDLGVTGELGGDLSLPLGTSSLTLLEMTSAYAAVAGGRYPVRPTGLAEADNRWSDWMARRTGRIDPDRDWPMMLDFLWASANQGTGRAAALRVPTFGKTGTTQDNRDALFIGFAEDIVVGVWIGNDDNSPMRGISGGGAPARIWRDFMTGAIALDRA